MSQPRKTMLSLNQSCIETTQQSMIFIYSFQVLKSSSESIATVFEIISMFILFSCPGYLKEQVLQWSAGKHRAETHLKESCGTVISKYEKVHHSHCEKQLLSKKGKAHFCYDRSFRSLLQQTYTGALNIKQEKRNQISQVPKQYLVHLLKLCVYLLQMIEIHVQVLLLTKEKCIPATMIAAPAIRIRI